MSGYHARGSVIAVVMASACSSSGSAERSPATEGTTAAPTSTSTAPPPSTGGTPSTQTGDVSGIETSSGSSTGATSTGIAESSTGENAMPTSWTPVGTNYELLCKLISDTDVEAPTANDTHHQANLQGTDLGIPLVVDEDLYLFFGDTQGYRQIWAPGEDPDSVARVDAATVRSDPSALCTGLRFLLTPDEPSVAAEVDPSILRDFAAGSMIPPPGEPLSSYIEQFPPPFESIPGTFEVPTGALRIGDDVYTFWAGKTELSPRPRMTQSYVARWDQPRVLPEYQIVRPFDALQDGALGGHFIQVLPFATGDTIHVLGSGDYRHSGVSLMRFGASELETGFGAELFDPRSQSWLDVASARPGALVEVPTLFESDGVGELGGLYLEREGVFVVLYQRELHGPGGEIIDNRVVVRTAAQPEGPWSEAVTVIDMADPTFTSRYCCGGGGCEGEQILNCFVAGLYAIYPLPGPRVTPTGEGALDLELAFLASTWNPYNVVLFQTQLRVLPGYE